MSSTGMLVSGGIQATYGKETVYCIHYIWDGPGLIYKTAVADRICKNNNSFCYELVFLNDLF